MTHSSITQGRNHMHVSRNIQVMDLKGTKVSLYRDILVE